MSIRALNDNELVQLYIDGNEDSLAMLVNRHKQRIFSSIITIVKDRQLAEDVFQDTFFKVITTLKKKQYNEEGKFLPWVLRIARNIIIDHFRRAKKMPPVPVFINDEGEEITIFSSLAAEDNTASNQEKSLFKRSVRDLITELPYDQREVVMMRIYYNMSFKEIAEFTNVSINTSLGRMRYAMMSLKKKIEERNLELTLIR